jgi:hypothetical protein
MALDQQTITYFSMEFIMLRDTSVKEITSEIERTEFFNETCQRPGILLNAHVSSEDESDYTKDRNC